MPLGANGEFDAGLCSGPLSISSTRRSLNLSTSCWKVSVDKPLTVEGSRQPTNQDSDETDGRCYGRVMGDISLPFSFIWAWAAAP